LSYLSSTSASSTSAFSTAPGSSNQTSAVDQHREEEDAAEAAYDLDQLADPSTTITDPDLQSSDPVAGIATIRRLGLDVSLEGLLTGNVSLS